MSTINASCVGYVKYDPELRFTVNGNALCTFKLEEDSGRWHRIVVWGELGEVCNAEINRNDKLSIKGYFKSRQWEKDGEKRSITELIAQKIFMLDPEFVDMAKVLREIKVNGN